MFHIAVCDADPIFYGWIEQCALEYAREIGSGLEVEQFGCGQRLRQHIQAGNPVDMVFMNERLLDMTGLYAARLLRTELGLTALPLVFISVKTADLLELFSVRPQNLLKKPVDAQQIRQEIGLALQLQSVPHRMFICMVKRQTYRIPMTDILYLESNAHKIILTHTKGQLRFYGKLNEAIRQLDCSGNFVQIHKSFIINERFLYQYTAASVTMSNGRRIPVSQRCKAALRGKLQAAAAANISE